MAEIKLGPFFTEPLHPIEWADYGRKRFSLPESQRNDYRITNPYDGPDLINGGKHEATDVGDGHTHPTPFLSPIDGQARGLYHHDTARGVEFRLPDGWAIKAWHLATTLPVAMVPGTSAVGPWQVVRKGQQVGTTGNTGKQPMPDHTHLELWDGTQRRDIEPYLFGAVLVIGDDEVNEYVRDLEFAYNRSITLVSGATARSAPRFNPKNYDDYRVFTLDKDSTGPLVGWVEGTNLTLGSGEVFDPRKRWAVTWSRGTGFVFWHERDVKSVNTVEVVQSGYTADDMEEARTQSRTDGKAIQEQGIKALENVALQAKTAADALRAKRIR